MFKAHIFFKRLCITWCKQGMGAAFIDKSVVHDKSGHMYNGFAILLKPWKRNEYGESLIQPALVLTWKS